MKAADRLAAQFKANLNESLGARLRPPASTTPGTGASASLVPTPAAVSPEDGKLRARDAGHLEIDRIIPDPHQPRREFTEEALERLASSMKSRGQLLPVRVRWDGSLGKWIIISGERRYRSALRAGFKTVSCVFVDRDLTPSEIMQEQLVENLIREDLKPVEQAHGFQALLDANSWAVKDLAEALHVSAPSICRALALLKLPDGIQGQVDAGTLPASAAYELTKLPTVAEQELVAEVVIAEQLTRDQVVEEVRKRTGKPATRRVRGDKPAGPPPDSLARQLDTGSGEPTQPTDEQQVSQPELPTVPVVAEAVPVATGVPQEILAPPLRVLDTRAEHSETVCTFTVAGGVEVTVRCANPLTPPEMALALWQVIGQIEGTQKRPAA